MPGRGGVAGEHDIDPVGHPARTPQVLPLHSRGVLTGLLLPRLIEHQYRPSRVTQVGQHERADLAHRVRRVPGGALQQPLHLVRGLVPGLLSQRPAVLARQVADQPGHVLACLPARLHPGEARRQAPHQLIQHPAGQTGLFYSGGSSRLKIVYCHELMITRRLSHDTQIRLIQANHPTPSTIR